MTRRIALAETLGISLTVLAAGQQGGPRPGTLLSYNGAFYTVGAFPGTPRLWVFPVTGRAFNISLPFVFRAYTFDPTGGGLYAAPTSLRGLFMVQFNPLRTTLVRGSESLNIIGVAVAARRDKIVIRGGYPRDGDTKWGIFELDPADGQTRPVLSHEAPPLPTSHEPWYDISVSPDAARAVAMLHGELVSIDLAEGTFTPLGPGLEQGAWSPDGKWLAVNDRKTVRTVLLDAITLKPVRSVVWSHLKWSPDSRYLLGAAAHTFFCGPYSGTLQAIDVATGKTTRISSSECRIDSTTTGWVNADIR